MTDPHPLFKQDLSTFTQKVDHLLTKLQYDLMQKYIQQSDHTKFPSLQSDVQLASQSIIFLVQQFFSFTRTLKLEALNQPLKKIISFEHFLSNLILNLFHSASQFFNERYIQYKCERLQAISKQTPNTQCVPIQQLTLQNARKQQFQDKERLEAFINENQCEERDDLIDHLSNILSSMESNVAKTQSSTAGELQSLQEKIQEIVQFVAKVESESKSNSVDRFQYFQTNREDILDVINTVTIQLSNTLKENFKNGVKKTLRSFTENCRGKQAVLATTETQTDTVESKSEEASKIQKLKGDMRKQEKQINSLNNRCQLYKSAMERTERMVETEKDQNKKLNLIIENLATNLQQAEEKSKNNEVAAFKTQKNLFDLFDKMEEQEIFQKKQRKNSINQQPSIGLIPAETVETGVQVEEIIGSEFQVMGIQKKEMSLLNSNIQKESKIKKLSDQNASLVRNLNCLLEKIGGGQFAKELLQSIAAEGMTEGIMKDILGRYNDSLREANKAKRKSLKQFLMSGMNISNESPKQVDGEKLANSSEARQNLEKSILEMDEDEEIEDIIRNLSTHFNSTIPQPEASPLDTPEHTSSNQATSRSIQKTESRRVNQYTSLNNSIEDTEIILESKHPALRREKLSTQKIQKLSRPQRLRINKGMKEMEERLTDSLTNSLIVERQNSTFTNSYNTVTLGCNTQSNPSLILSAQSKPLKRKNNLQNNPDISRRNLTEFNQIPFSLQPKGEKKPKLNILTPTFLQTNKMRSVESRSMSKKPGFEKLGTTFYKPKEPRSREVSVIKRGEDSTMNKILLKSYQITKEKQIYLPKDQELPKLRKRNNQ